MSLNRHQTSVSAVAAKHAAEKRPTVSILGFALAGDGLARITAEIAHNRFSREDHNLALESINAMFDNKLSAVCGSFMSVDKAPYTERVAGVLRVNTQVVPKEAAKDFRSVSSNIFMDTEDQMWVLRKTEAGDVLVKNTGIEDHESLRGLLGAMCSAGYSLSSEFKAAEERTTRMQQAVQGGSFVQYVSAMDTQTKFGFVVASADEDKLIVLPSDDSAEDGEVVDRNAVVAEYDTEDMPDVEMNEQEEMDAAVSVSRGVMDINVLLNFYKKVFARSPQYFQEFAKRARGHCFA